MVMLLGESLGGAVRPLRRQLRQLLQEGGSLRLGHHRAHQNSCIHRRHHLSGTVQRRERIIHFCFVDAHGSGSPYAFHPTDAFPAVDHQISLCKHGSSSLPHGKKHGPSGHAAYILW